MSAWPLWRRQIAGVFALEFSRRFLGRRAFAIYAVAALPVALAVLYAVLPIPEDVRGGPAQAAAEFANLFNAFIVRTLVFLACVLVFSNLVRGDIAEQVLHYYFLAPARREVIVVGKFVAGWISTSVVFSLSTAVTYVLIVLARHSAEGRAYLLDRPGLGHPAMYVLAVCLACLGYGALFLLIGVLFRNPIVPAVALWGWEWLNFLLPAALKKLSVIHFVQSLAPLPIDEGPLAVVAEPTSAWIAVPGVLVVSAGLLWLAARRMRDAELSYGPE